MRLSQRGEIVQKWWEEITVHFENVETGAFVLMPNHVHGIIFITGRRGTVLVPENLGGVELGGKTPPLRQKASPLRTPTLGQIVA